MARVAKICLLLLLLAVQDSFALCPSGYEEGRELAPGLLQLTSGKPGMRELADPAPPYETSDGSIEIYGTGDSFLRYPSWKEFSRGGCYKTLKLDIYFRGKNHQLLPSDAPWDLRKFQLSAGGVKKEVLLGGAMSPGESRELPAWPDDNPSRRIYIFRQGWEKPNAWVRDDKPMAGDTSTGWLGHSYGGNLFQAGQEKPQLIDGSRPVYFFYEKVSTKGGPEKTGLYVTKSNDGKPEELPVFIDTRYPSSQRGNGGTLAEGARPIEVSIRGKKYFLLGFSSGDFPTDHYTINFLWSREPLGPYEPLLTKDGKDLEDFGAAFKKELSLSWVGRPALFRKPGGGYELLFHGVFKSAQPENDYTKWPKAPLQSFVRQLFKTPVELALGTDGKPTLKVLFGASPR